MKKQKLETLLKDKGSFLIRQGGNHEIWESRKGCRFTVPRHLEIKEATARMIIKQADK